MTVIRHSSSSKPPAAAGASIDIKEDVDRPGDHPVDENQPDEDQHGNGQAIAELRRLSGLTWDQLARLFGVSRRSLHFWASGKAMSAGNREHLQHLLFTLRTRRLSGRDRGLSVRGFLPRRLERSRSR